MDRSTVGLSIPQVRGVETMQGEGRDNVHFTDYGHRGQVGATQMRILGFKERMMLVQGGEVKFQLPNSNQELEAQLSSGGACVYCVQCIRLKGITIRV